MKRLPLAFAALITLVLPAQAQETQSILGPGLYVFQTRIISATCNDATRTGFVSSYYAAIDGIPASRTMRMNLINSQFWPRWNLQVNPPTITGEARQPRVDGVSRFEIRVDGSNRFTGRGTREYRSTVDGHAMRCAIQYDTLLKRID